MPQTSRFGEPADKAAQLAAGWSLTYAQPPSALFGANGMRFGPDGQLYVAQAFGSQVSALDPESGAVRTVSPVGGPIVGPDDLAFDTKGTMFATEVMSKRVSARMPDGTVRVVAENVPAANGVTAHGDRVFMDEFRPGGRMFELYADGRAPRLIAKDLPFPNALCLGPDDNIYFPAVPLGEIWRVPVEGGEAERFLGGLALPVAVKFDSSGALVTTQSGSGEITRIDLQSGNQTRIAQVRPGIDNFAFGPDGRLFVSHFVDGGVAEILAGGKERTLVAPGLVGPWGIAVGPDGTLYVADGLSFMTLTPGGATARPGMLLMHGFPGVVRSVAIGADGTVYLANSAGGVSTYVPGEEAKFLIEGLDRVMGIAVGPDGTVYACESGGGRVVAAGQDGNFRTVATGLGQPTGIAVAGDGAVYVAEAANGRVVQVRSGESASVLDGLQEPHGVAVSGGDLFVLDRGGKALHRVSLGTKRAEVVARNLPVGAQPGIVPKTLPGIEDVLPGPLLPFAGLAAAPGGTLYVAADGDGSILALRPS